MDNVNKNLKLILDKFRQNISKEQFCFKRYITEYDRDNKCGTICCIAGWFPKLFPNSGLYWMAGEIGGVLIVVSDFGDDIPSHLTKLIGTTSMDLIRYLFYGKGNLSDKFKTLYPDKPELSADSEYEQVIKAWEYMIQHYKETNPYSLT